MIESEIRVDKPEQNSVDQNRGGGLQRLLGISRKQILAGAAAISVVIAPAGQVRAEQAKCPPFMDVVLERLPEEIKERIQQKIPISESDIRVVQKIRNRFPDDIVFGEVPKQTGDEKYGYEKAFRLECLDMGDEDRCFMNMIIKSPDLVEAKKASVRWLRYLGFSDKGIRGYPIVYSCDYEAGDCKSLKPFADDIIPPDKN